MKKDPYAHLRTEKAMRIALRSLKAGTAMFKWEKYTDNRKYYELVVFNALGPLAVFDLRRCINDRPGLKGIKKVLAPRRRR